MAMMAMEMERRLEAMREQFSFAGLLAAYSCGCISGEREDICMEEHHMGSIAADI